MILVPLFDLKFLAGLAAASAGISNRRHEAEAAPFGTARGRAPQSSDRSAGRRWAARCAGRQLQAKTM